MNTLTFNVPLTLTFIRLLVSPLLLPFLLVYFLPLHVPLYNVLLGIFFIVLSLTDFFDGYLARRYGQITVLGRLLDPIADKFLLYSTLIPLVYIHKIYFYWALLFIGREFFIMALRQVAQSYGYTLSVSYKAKLKTCFQMAYLTWVIMNPYPGGLYIFSSALEYFFLFSALFFSLYSAAEYYFSFFKQVREML